MPRGYHFGPEDISHPGEANGRHVLCELQVRLLYQLAKEGTYSQKEIGRLFGVSQSAVRDVKLRRTWSHLDYGDGSKG
jgi:predicted XRE-type DNA-binding protein